MCGTFSRWSATPVDGCGCRDLRLLRFLLCGSPAAPLMCCTTEVLPVVAPTWPDVVVLAGPRRSWPDHHGPHGAVAAGDQLESVESLVSPMMPSSPSPSVCLPRSRSRSASIFGANGISILLVVWDTMVPSRIRIFVPSWWCRGSLRTRWLPTPCGASKRQGGLYKREYIIK